MTAPKTYEVEFKVPESDGNFSGQWVWKLGDLPGVKETRLETIFIHGDYYLHVRATRAGLKLVRAFCSERGYEECR
jgi:hypothetical protein